MDTPKKHSLCSCGSGRVAYRCCAKARTRTASPEGALELLCFLRNKGVGYLKSEVERHTGLSRYNCDSVLQWAQGQKLVQVVSHQDGWPRLRADVAAIDRWMAAYGAAAPPPREHAKRNRTNTPRSPRARAKSLLPEDFDGNMRSLRARAAAAVAA